MDSLYMVINGCYLVIYGIRHGYIWLYSWLLYNGYMVIYIYSYLYIWLYMAMNDYEWL